MQRNNEKKEITKEHISELEKIANTKLTATKESKTGPSPQDAFDACVSLGRIGLKRSAANLLDYYRQAGKIHCHHKIKTDAMTKILIKALALTKNTASHYNLNNIKPCAYVRPLEYDVYDKITEAARGKSQDSLDLLLHYTGTALLSEKIYLSDKLYSLASESKRSTISDDNKELCKATITIKDNSDYLAAIKAEPRTAIPLFETLLANKKLSAEHVCISRAGLADAHTALALVNPKSGRIKQVIDIYEKLLDQTLSLGTLSRLQIIYNIFKLAITSPIEEEKIKLIQLIPKFYNHCRELHILEDLKKLSSDKDNNATIKYHLHAAIAACHTFYNNKDHLEAAIEQHMNAITTLPSKKEIHNVEIRVLRNRLATLKDTNPLDAIKHLEMAADKGDSGAAINVAKRAREFGLHDKAFQIYKNAMQTACKNNDAKSMMEVLDSTVDFINKTSLDNIEEVIKQIIVPVYEKPASFYEKNPVIKTALCDQAQKIVTKNPDISLNIIHYLNLYVSITKKDLQKIQQVAQENYLPAVNALAELYTRTTRTFGIEYPQRARILIWTCLVLLNRNDALKKQQELSVEECKKTDDMASEALTQIEKIAMDKSQIAFNSKPYRHREFAQLCHAQINIAERNKCPITDPLAYLLTAFNGYTEDDLADLKHALKDAFAVNNDWINKKTEKAFISVESSPVCITEPTAVLSAYPLAAESMSAEPGSMMVTLSDILYPSFEDAPAPMLPSGSAYPNLASPVVEYENKHSHATQIVLFTEFLLKNKNIEKKSGDPQSKNLIEICNKAYIILLDSSEGAGEYKAQAHLAKACLRALEASKSRTIVRPFEYLMEKFNNTTFIEHVYAALDISEKWVENKLSFGPQAVVIAPIRVLPSAPLQSVSAPSTPLSSTAGIMMKASIYPVVNATPAPLKVEAELSMQTSLYPAVVAMPAPLEVKKELPAQASFYPTVVAAPIAVDVNVELPPKAPVAGAAVVDKKEEEEEEVVLFKPRKTVMLA